MFPDNEKYVEQLTKAKELIEELSSSLSVVGECEEEECELLNRAEQFLKDSNESHWSVERDFEE